MTQSAGRKRHIRIKEFGADVDRVLSPSAHYLAEANATLTPGDFALHTDRDGFIVDPRLPATGSHTVFVLGDSFVESSYVPEGERFCDRLSARLADRGYRFLNGGHSGATSLQLFNTLVNKILGRQDFSVLLVLPSNDALALREAGGYWNYASQRYSPILPVDPAPPDPAPPDPAPPDRPAGAGLARNIGQAEAVLRSYAYLSLAFGFELFFATTPFMQTGFEQEPWFAARYRNAAAYEARMAERRRLNEVMRTVATSNRVPLLDLERSLMAPEWFYDEVHLNRTGSRIVAGQIARAVAGRDPAG